MKHIGEIVPEVIETMAQLTRTESVTTAPTEKPSMFSWEFDTLGDPILADMLFEAQTFCRDMRDRKPPRWLCLLGTSGAGKTHLARKISEWFKRNLAGELEPGQDEEKTRWRMHGGFVSWRKLTDDLRNGDYGRYRDICDEWFLALDDIGAEYKTPFITSKLDQLFDARQRKWTVVTGNLSLAQIKEQMDARIASRMIRNGSVVVDVNVPDYNLRKRAA